MKLEASKTGTHTVRIGERKLTFDQKVAKVSVAPDKVLVLLNPIDFAEDDPDAGRNILALDSKGDLIWKIEDAGFKIQLDGGREMPDGYVGMKLWSDGRFSAFQGIGCRCFIDLKTGKITGEEPTR